MSAAAVKTFKLVMGLRTEPLGTDWALTQFRGSKSCKITTYKTGHHFLGGKEAKEKNTLGCKLVELGTCWALTQFKGSKSCQITSYETGHHFPGGKA